MKSLTLDSHARLLVLTGAGISAESGVATFRGAGGLWEGHSVESVASPEGFARDPALVWRFYSERRAQVEQVKPNAGHLALVAAERMLGDRFLLVTQNVDGLHLAAGSKRVVEIHGNLFQTRCVSCQREPFLDRRLYLKPPLPVCDVCTDVKQQTLLRPDIVWFGEMLDESHLDQIDRFIEEAGPRLIFLAVGTSGAVYPAAGLVDAARAVGGQTWLVNLDPADNQHRFHHFIQGQSGAILPSLLEISTH